jgi:hypothetical protein
VTRKIAFLRKRVRIAAEVSDAVKIGFVLADIQPQIVYVPLALLNSAITGAVSARRRGVHV